jgi:hypothetical protein
MFQCMRHSCYIYMLHQPHFIKPTNMKQAQFSMLPTHVSAQTNARMRWIMLMLMKCKCKCGSQTPRVLQSVGPTEAHTVSNHYRCESTGPGSNFWHREESGRASTQPVAMTGHAWGLMMPTVSGKPTLCHLTPVWFSSRAPVAHTTRRDGTGCHDRLTTPVCGASGK